MPPPGVRRRRPSLAKFAVSSKEQPEWLLRRREEGWNERFAVDRPSVGALYQKRIHTALQALVVR